MSMFEKVVEKLKQRRLKKAELLRRKNAKMRSEGKDPLKGWGKMIDSGIGGANRANPLDTKYFHIEDQKNLREQIKKNK